MDGMSVDQKYCLGVRVEVILHRRQITGIWSAAVLVPQGNVEKNSRIVELQPGLSFQLSLIELDGIFETQVE